MNDGMTVVFIIEIQPLSFIAALATKAFQFPFHSMEWKEAMIYKESPEESTPFCKIHYGRLSKFELGYLKNVGRSADNGF